MADIEELRQRRMQQLLQQQMQQQLQQQVQQQLQEEEMSAQIKLIINKILTPEARERLSNIRTVRPAYARQIEILLIQLYQAGKLPQQLTDDGLKEILLKIQSAKREGKIEKR